MSEIQLIPVEQILPNPDQPRKDFDPAGIASLAASIREHGLIQPITVEVVKVGEAKRYILVDGERRLRAHKMAGIDLIRAEINDVDGQKKSNEKLFLRAMVANSQRSDLNVIEEAKAYLELIRRGYKQKEIAELVGRSISHVNFRLKLLEFEQEVQDLFAAGKLAMDPNVIYSLAKLPDEYRSRMAVRFSQRGTGVQGIKAGVTRVLKVLQRGDVDIDLTHGKLVPSRVMSEDEPRRLGMMERIVCEGSLPEWRLIEQAAKETCENCELFDMASAQMCKDCPAVDLLKRLNKLVAEKE